MEEEKKLRLATDSCSNSADVRISNRTLLLVRSRAKLSDIYSTVQEVNELVYGLQADEILSKFREAFFNLDYELIELISKSIDEKSMDSNYKEI